MEEPDATEVVMVFLVVSFDSIVVVDETENDTL
jgi:hypothetical protein